MSKRQTNRQYAKRRSPVLIGLSSLTAIVSLALVYLSGRLLAADLAAFRSCDTNSSGLQVATCGKHGLNFSDLIFLVFFGLSVALTASLCTASWRMTRRITG